MQKLKIVTDATCRKSNFYKGRSTGAAKFFDLSTGELVHEQSYILGELTSWAAEYRTILEALDTASEITRGEVQVWTDAEYAVRHMNGDYRLKRSEAKRFFDKATQLGQRFDKVSYFHHDRGAQHAKLAHEAAAVAFEENHIK